MKQQTACRLAGLHLTALTAIELGRKGADALEIRALASAYSKTEKDIGALFVPPSIDEWQLVLAEFQPDPKFRKAPTGRPFG